MLAASRVVQARRDDGARQWGYADHGAWLADGDSDEGRPWLCEEWAADSGAEGQQQGDSFDDSDVGVWRHVHDPVTRTRTGCYANGALLRLVNMGPEEAQARVGGHDLPPHMAELDFLCLLLHALYASTDPQQQRPRVAYLRWQWPGACILLYFGGARGARAAGSMRATADNV